MRVTEFAATITEQWDQISKLVGNPSVPIASWVAIVEQHVITNSILHEAIDSSIQTTIQNLADKYNKNLAVGKKYIPIPVQLIHNMLQVFDSQCQLPATSPATFCTLIKMPDSEFTVTSDSGKTFTWPNSLVRPLSYSTMIFAKNKREYDEIRSWLSLSLSATLPEFYQPPSLEVGDEIKKGKFKNSPAVVKGFKKDKHNQPVLKTNKGDVQLFKPRITKLMKESLDYQGNCTEDDVIEHIFGDVNNFANMVEEYGDEFEVGDLVVTYDEDTDIHSFYYKTPDKLMKEEVLDEYENGTDNSRQIFAKLKELGYERLGSGQDATVWSKDDASVIKILMPSDKPYNAENGFLTFYNFCQQHKDLPNLPKFIDIGGAHHTVFTINGTNYRQIAMERLLPIPNNSFEEAMVWALSDMCMDRSYRVWEQVTDTLISTDIWLGCESPVAEYMHELVWEKMRHSDMDGYKLLFTTMQMLYMAGKQAGLGWDLHTENVMIRRDGTLVIVDPFYS
jgi:hypothetical protein